ncbi:MFS transporter [Allonocardiopsis opalescens]|uniref:Putative MFS family arabinose efflux permease n=1 Tax=Allonocardiopsis opalescens TaxID=1144618 RepID=A0A2T0QF87_9ACTN|nr:MFS transporter [Allonocardiopsis opalescens]PRY02511.1 putative MFS family arabinose efflux permease [Allonocardiopsis opalescens]
MSRAAEAARFYRPFLPLFGALFCCLLGVGATLATVPFFVQDRLGGSDVEVGTAVAAIAVSAVITRPLAGRVADRRGHRNLMLAGAVVCVLAGAAYLAAGDLVSLVAVRVLHGIGEGTVYTAGAAWLVALAPPERRGRVVGLYGISMWSGITLGALLGAVVMSYSGFAAVWLSCAGLAVVAVALVLAAPRPVRAPGTGARGGLLPSSVVLPGIALSLAAFGYAALAAFVALHMSALGVSGGIAALNAFGVTYVGVRLFVGHWPDRYGGNRVAVWSALAEAVGLALVAFAPNIAVAVLGGLVMGAGLSLLFPALALVVLNRTDSSRQGAALGAFTSFWDIGLAAGAPAAGYVALVADYRTAYLVMLVCALASAGLVWLEAAGRRARAVPTEG